MTDGFPLLLRRREATNAPDSLAGRRNLLQLVQLRWLAVAGQFATVLTVHVGMGGSLPLRELLTLLVGLSLFNVASWLRCRSARGVIGNGELFVGLLVDVAVLSGLLYFTGGVTNPFIFLYLLQVAVGAVLLQPRYIWSMVVLTATCFAVLTVWYRPLALPEFGDLSFTPPYIVGLLSCFALNAALLVIFIDRIGRNLRARDAHVAALRQRAAEEEHIVRMGLLASGAAHELGTPLATLSVILGDWLHMPAFAQDPELREEIGDMQAQLLRCKAIVSGILLSAGEPRGEASVATTLEAFFDELVTQWRSTRPAQPLHYAPDALPDDPIVSDSALKQMLGNVLDNAADAAPGQPLRLEVSCPDDWLIVRVSDQGPGFAPEMLAQFGTPYQSSKGRPGGGLGLFLSLNVARTLGGQIEARNRPGGGADVLLRLPLAALTLEERRAPLGA